MANVYCPECGFQNPEAANYCAKCGTLLVPRGERRGDDGVHARAGRRERQAELAELGINGPALVVRSGGGRAGETFILDGERDDDRPLAGLRHLPRRRHGLAEARRREAGRGELEIEDLGSLNGTFLNRRRIESGDLADGDELQIGKYRLTFLEQ